jgi:hypothetical protein
MGYIAPITHYEYIQYANRTEAAEKEGSKAVEGLKPVFHLDGYSQMMDEREKQEQNEDGEKVRDAEIKATRKWGTRANYQPLINQVPDYIVEQTFMEMTGRGLIVNEKI